MDPIVVEIAITGIGTSRKWFVAETALESSTRAARAGNVRMER
jgi:hypothetical protein